MVEPFATEAEMVKAWLAPILKRRADKWTAYPETAGWDVLLVHRDGYQVGIEAKLSLNAKVLAQSLAGLHSYWDDRGPDYRAVLVPAGKCQLHMKEIARALGVVVLKARQPEPHVIYSVDLPEEDSDFGAWPNWCPTERCALPDYVPDVAAGCSSPLMLTPWKVKAIKLMILLEKRGRVTRADMKALQISPTRWTDHWNGFLSPSREFGGYVRNERTPDLRAQHPINFAQIEADFVKWCPPGYLLEQAAA